MKIFSEKFKKYFDSIDDGCKDLDDFARYTQKNIKELANEMHIGKIELTCSFDKSTNGDKKNDTTIGIFSGDGKASKERAMSVRYDTPNLGSIVICIMPENDYSWNSEEKQEVEFLGHVLFSICSRIKAVEIAEDVLKNDRVSGALNPTGMDIVGNNLLKRESSTSFAAMFINIKNFKLVNNMYSEKVGDQVLKEVVSSIKNFFGRRGIVGRMGGDNFVVLMKKDIVREFLGYMNPLHVQVNTDRGIKDIKLVIRAGVYYLRDGDNMGNAISCSNIAYSATRRGGAQDVIFFLDSMMKNVMESKKISMEFSQTKVNEEFLVYYQPKVSLEDNTIRGAEALVRWNKDGKVLAPAKFISILEKDGSIVKIDFFVFETVCRDIRNWLDKGIIPEKISINFSRAHLENENVVDDILEIMHRYDVDPKYLEIEITESASYEDYKSMNDFVLKLKHNKISVAIDDFGTGFSSLSILTNLEPNVVKLDKSFMDHATSRGEKDKLLFKNIVDMVAGLNLDVITEGVETMEQVKFLINVKCTYVQGFLFDKPLPHDEFEKRLIDQKAYVIS